MADEHLAGAAAVIDALRTAALAAAAGKEPIAPPESEDSELLTLAARGMDLHARARERRRAHDDLMDEALADIRPRPLIMPERTPAQEARKAERLAAADAALAEAFALDAQLRTVLRRAAKLRSQTPAGIFAKVGLVAASKTGAAVLAQSAAAELLACAELRRAVWPAGDAGAAP